MLPISFPVHICRKCVTAGRTVFWLVVLVFVNVCHGCCCCDYFVSWDEKLSTGFAEHDSWCGRSPVWIAPRVGEDSQFGWPVGHSISPCSASIASIVSMIWSLIRRPYFAANVSNGPLLPCLTSRIQAWWFRECQACTRTSAPLRSFTVRCPPAAAVVVVRPMSSHIA